MHTEIDYIDKCQNKLISFARAVYPGFETPMHLIKIAEELEAVERGDSRRVILTVPPRFGKSLLASQIFPAWFLGKRPKEKILLASNTQMLASDFGRSCRNIMLDPTYRIIFPEVSVSEDSKAKNTFKTNQNGEAFFLGIGGTIVGRGANCFVGETMIQTEWGAIDIATLHTMKNRPRVLSFDHKHNIMVYRPIIASRKQNTQQLCKATTKQGRQIISTPEHRFYSVQQKQYVPIKNLNNEKLYTYSSSNMRFLPYRIHAMVKGLSKEHPAWTSRQLLFTTMFPKSSRNQKPASVRNMSKADCQENTTFLRKLQINSQTRGAKNARNMFYLQNNFYNEKQSNNLLFAPMRRSGTFSKNDWQKQFKLQNRNQLCKMVQGDEAINYRTRSTSMFAMSYTGKYSNQRMAQQNAILFQSGSASYRPKSWQQSPKQFDYFMPEMSSDNSSCEIDSINQLEIYRTESVPVYDIQVAGTSNFFANEILVHNCALIDDPIKNAEEADSDVYIQKLHNWYREVLYTRQMPGGRIIIIMQRWRNNDLVGWLTDPKEQELVENWKIINFPAIATEDTDWRKTGDALWPERYPLPELEKIRIAIGSRSFAGLYQQQPSIQEGNIIKREWLKIDRIDEESLIAPRILSLDTAYKEGTGNDYSAAVVAQRTRNGICILYAEQRKLAFPALIEWIKALVRAYSIQGVIVEDKASGISVIQTLRDKTNIPVIGIKIKPGDDKESRLHAITPYLESGRVTLHKWSPSSTQEELINNLLQFPNGAHDDLTDAFVHAIGYLIRPGLSAKRLIGGGRRVEVPNIYDR